MPIATKLGKAAKGKQEPETIFKSYSSGVLTGRDSTVYEFDSIAVNKRVENFIEVFNDHVSRHQRGGKNPNIDDTVDYTKAKWSRNLKRKLTQDKYKEYSPEYVRTAMYRPYSKRFLYFDTTVVDEVGQFRKIYPDTTKEAENRTLWWKVGANDERWVLITNCIADKLPNGGSQCFPFYTYNEDGTNRRENITDWALAQFRAHYADESISKWDIFYYVYALLHHPQYRQKYAAALKKELPRIPFVPNGSGELKVMRDARKASDESEVMSDEKKQKSSENAVSEGESANESGTPHHSSPITQNFFAFAKIGRALADLHLNYETVKPYPLTETWAKGRPADYRVEKMKWKKNSDESKVMSDEKKQKSSKTAESEGEIVGLSGAPHHSSLVVNSSLSLGGFPAEAFGYTLGGRSALDWVVEQYQVKTDKRSGIVSDPNQYSDDEKYIVELVKRVTTVSVETVKLVGALPPLG